jgi:hypothetical protein
LRAAAGRRALQLALLVGGLCALGLLCGEQAHAADRIPVPAKATSLPPVTSVATGQQGRADSAGAVRTARKVTDRTVALARGLVTDAPQSAQGLVTDAPQSVQGLDTHTAQSNGGVRCIAQSDRGGRCTAQSERGLGTGAPHSGRGGTNTARSVRDLVTETSRSTPGLVTRTSRSTPGLVTRTARSTQGLVTDASRSVRDVVIVTPRSVRDVVTATSRPVLGVVTATSQSARDVVTTASQSVRAVANRSVQDTRTTGPSLPLPDFGRVPDLDQVPVLGQVTGPQAPSPHARRHGGTAAVTPAKVKQDTARAAASASAAITCGLEAAPAPRPHAWIPAAQRTKGLGDTPGRPAPGEDPDGLLGKQAADGSAFRHGDGFAVTLSDRAPVRLAPGVTARDDAPATRERHRDIPVFPG